MSLKLDIRPLRAEEIDCRVATVSAKGATILLYKDARCDMRILDELVGPFGWRRDHQVIDGNLYCTVSIRDEETGEWVSKQDVGTESNTEKEKGQASDSFKRACFNWGIGRELYTAPFVFVKRETTEDGKTSKGKTIYRLNDPYEKFRVAEISHDEDKNIIHLIILGKNNSIAFIWDKPVDDRITAAEQEAGDIFAGGDYIGPEEVKTLKTLASRKGSALDDILAYYEAARPEDMTIQQYAQACELLRRKADVK